MKIILTTTDNQKNNSNENMTSINLGECENLLRNFYNITDGKIYMKKIDIIQNNMKIPKIEYEVYSKLNGSNLLKLDLSICGTSKISLSIPVEISENLDKLNASSDYFNSICYTITSENGTDIPLKDRQKEFVESNKAICQENCNLNDYDYITKKANCSCKTKVSPISFADMNINKTKLYNNFIDVKNVANINILICYKKLLKKDGLIYNIGSYIVIAILIFHIICIIIFYVKQYNILKLKIKDITFAIKNLSQRTNINKVKKLGRNAIKIINTNNRNKKTDGSKSSRNLLKTNESNKIKNNNKSIRLKDHIGNRKDNKVINRNNNIHNNNLNLKSSRRNNFFGFFLTITIFEIKTRKESIIT